MSRTEEVRITQNCASGGQYDMGLGSAVIRARIARAIAANEGISTHHLAALLDVTEWPTQQLYSYAQAAGARVDTEGGWWPRPTNEPLFGDSFPV
ncbi:MAG: hypothetical protein EOP32_31470 [Rhodococcus sp. (in: high G+C Gram-positive bacteria)]|nr:MAG: hypothetical protein EOP32_31470 [Rhodococcus sp. (in: high G+C Gram-positive bacteria)]